MVEYVERDEGDATQQGDEGSDVGRSGALFRKHSATETTAHRPPHTAHRSRQKQHLTIQQYTCLRDSARRTGSWSSSYTPNASVTASFDTRIRFCRYTSWSSSSCRHQVHENMQQHTHNFMQRGVHGVRETAFYSFSTALTPSSSPKQQIPNQAMPCLNFA